MPPLLGGWVWSGKCPVKIYDISNSLSSETEVWPGDKPFSRHMQASLENDGYSLSWFEMSSHAGTHIDFPSHFFKGGKSADQIPLDVFWGPARVIEAEVEVSEQFLKPVLFDKPERLLIKTLGDELVIHPEAAELILNSGVKLIGVEKMSVDPQDSHDHLIHKILLAGEIVIVENLSLTGVPPGDYAYCGLPLKVHNAEAVPTRAILIEL